MKVLVAVKRVVDANVKIRVLPDGSGVDLARVKMAINPFDEIAVEEAIRLRDAGLVSEIVVVSVGPSQAQDTIRAALAMGADRGVLVMSDVPTEPLSVAKILAAVATEEAAGIVLMGKQAIDDDANQTGQMLAALLNWGQATFASKIVLANNVLTVTREVDGGLQTISVPLPAVVTADLRLNSPRYASLPNIMKAKSKPVMIRQVADFGIDMTPKIRVLKTEEPAQRKAGIKVANIAELLDKLRNEAGVL